MGFSYRVEAGKAEDKLSAACVKSTGSSNTFKSRSGNSTAFYEVDRVDQPDGGIAGKVNVVDRAGFVTSSARYRINGDGVLISGPGFFKAFASAAGVAVKTKYRSAMDVAAEACGLVKVRGALGGTYYE